MLVVSAPVHAGAEDPNTTSVWRYSFYKTVTYEFFANLADIPLYRALLGGAAPATAAFTQVNVVTAAAAYYSYEVMWNLYGPRIQDAAPQTAVRLELEKLLLYRVVSTARNLALVYALTGNATVTVGFAVASNVVDSALYIANEYGWYTYGPPVATGPSSIVSLFGPPSTRPRGPGPRQ
jgi:uncharacterized membrane protein